MVAGLRRSSPIATRASSPALSTFGSGSIASGIARNPSLQGRHSSPVRLGSGALSSGGEAADAPWQSPGSPPLSFSKHSPLRLSERQSPQPLGKLRVPRGTQVAPPGQNTSNAQSRRGLEEDFSVNEEHMSAKWVCKTTWHDFCEMLRIAQFLNELEASWILQYYTASS